MKLLRAYLQFISLVLFNTAVLGYLLPFLISYRDTSVVVVAVVLTALVVLPLDFLLVKSLITGLSQATTQKESKDENV